MRTRIPVFKIIRLSENTLFVWQCGMKGGNPLEGRVMAMIWSTNCESELFHCKKSFQITHLPGTFPFYRQINWSHMVDFLLRSEASQTSCLVVSGCFCPVSAVVAYLAAALRHSWPSVLLRSITLLQSTFCSVLNNLW